MMARGARLVTLEPSEDGRRADRHWVRLEVDELSGGVSITVQNLSATGLLIETSAGLLVGDELQVDLPHGGPHKAVVVWSNEHLFGCRFERPISRATISAARLRSSVNQPSTASSYEHKKPARQSAYFLPQDDFDADELPLWIKLWIKSATFLVTISFAVVLVSFWSVRGMKKIFSLCLRKIDRRVT